MRDSEKARNRAAADGAVMAAEAMLEEGAPLGVYTDSRSVPGWVIVGMARKGAASCAVAISAKEYDGLKLAAMIDPAWAALSQPAPKRQATAADYKA